MSLTILLEIGHDASLRSKTTSEGFTHDWEVFVKGQNGADIHYYVDKVVFYLHETFQNPKRVVKDPPFSLRTSGYAGFKLPIEIYLKNNQDPKRIKFNYELYLQPTGPPIHRSQKEKYTFFNPSEEFRSKLLKGGAVEGSGNNQENSINRGTVVEKNQMTSKPKLSGSDIPKKHKMKIEEPRNTDFENLFGPPIKKTSKIPEIPKLKEPPPKSSNLDKSIDKDKNDKAKSNKSTHKDKEKPKDKSSDNQEKKNKEERKKFKDEKSKDKERSKEKSSKKEKEREKSPLSRPRSPTPKRSPKRDLSPLPVQKHSSSKEKETNKEDKKDKDRDKDKKEEKKSKKDKRDHKEGKHKDRDRDKEHRDHKNKESKSREKESSITKQNEAIPVLPASAISQNSHKTDKRPKEKDQSKEQPKEEEKPEKSEKIRNESEERQKHKHKKKDRKEKKEDKHSKKEEKKIEKQPNLISNSKEIPVKEEKIISAPPSRQIDKSNLFGSPKSDSPKESESKLENNTIFSREDESSNDSVKLSSKEASPAPRVLSKSPSPLPPPEPIKKLEPEMKKEPSPKKKDKKEKKKDKKIDKEKDEKRKKRKSDSTTTVKVEPPEKVNKIEELINSDEESKVSSTEDTTPVVVPPKSECDMEMLRELQRKIMSLKDNADLQRVVQLIAETGQYEVSAHTFDFDLCLLDRSTVRQLQDFFSTITS